MIDLGLKRHQSPDRRRSSISRWVGRLEALEPRVVLNGAVNVPAQFGGSGPIPLHTFQITSIPEDANNDGVITTQTVTFTGFAENPTGGTIINAHTQITIEAVQGGTPIASVSLGDPNFQQDPTNPARANFQFQAMLQSAGPAPQAVTFRLAAAGFGTVPVVRTDNGQPLTATFTVDMAGPTVVQVGPLATEGTGTVATADVTFSEAIDPASFTNADLALTRDGVAVTLGTAVTVAQLSPTTFRVFGLRIPTAAPAAYVLTVNAAGIQDPLGNAGTGSQSANFAVSPPPPNGVVGVAAQFTGPAHDVVITSIPQDPDNDGRVNTQSVEFAGLVERANRATFTDTHLTLTVQALQGGSVIGSVDFTATPPGDPNAPFFVQDPNLPYRGIFRFPAALQSAGPDAQSVTFRILAQRTGQPPDTRDVVLGADSTQMLTATLTVDVAGPTVNPLPPVDTPRSQPLATLDVTFSEAIAAASFTNADLALTRDGAAVDLAAVTVTQVDATTFRVGNLEGVTTAPGAYVLTVNAAGVQDPLGNAGTGSQSANFVVLDVTGPTVVQVGPLATEGTGTVATADVTFSEAIDPASFTNADLALTRDGVAVTLGTAVTVAQLSPTTFRVFGLRIPTAAPAAYVLTVNAAGIQDPLGNAGTGSQSANFAVSPPPPNGVVGVAAQFTGPAHDVVITSIPQDPDNDGRVNTQSVEFAGLVERANRATFTDTHLTLTVQALQGGSVIGSVDFTATPPGDPNAPFFVQDPNLPYRGIFRFPAALQSAGPDAQSVTFRILAQRTGQPPDTRDVVLGADSTQMLTATLTVDVAGPTVNPLPPVDTPRSQPLATLDVTFSEAIAAASFTNADLALTRDGAAVDLAAVTVTQVDATTFRVGNLEGVTTAPGAYVLTVNAAGVQDPLGNAGTGSQAVSFSVDVAGPTVNPLPPVDTPRTQPVSTLDVTFSEAINASTFTIADLSLTRDGAAVSLAGVTISQVNATTFRIASLEAATTAPGAYVLTVNAAGVQDPLGNAGTASQAVNFTVQSTVVAGPQVVNLQRFGFHAQPTMLVLTFDRDLDPARAMDPNNYQIISPGRDRRIGTADDVVVPLSSGIYDAATRTVTLVPARRLSLFVQNRIIARGTGTGAITDRNGNLLDGDGDGRAGGDFSADFNGQILAGRASRLKAFLRGHNLVLQSFRPNRNGSRARG